MNRISIDCGSPAEPDIHDIGILAFTDPAALDQACIDLASSVQGNRSLPDCTRRQNGVHTLEHGEEIGLGSRSYHLVNIGE